MRAVVQSSYGSSDVLQLREVSRPVPQPGEVLIRVRTASLTPSDSAFRQGNPFLIRLMYGLRRPRFAVGGVEFAGDVVEAGAGVTRFQPGDAVFGLSADHFGAHGEYLTLPEGKPFVHKPAAMSYDDAISIADGPATALIFLRDAAKVRPGQRVLINGASGAVGAAGVQLAKYYGAEVTAVCSARNAEMVRQLGADHVIDYTRQDFTQLGQTWDVIFDAVGKRSYRQCRHALTPRGVYLNTVPSLGILLAMLGTTIGGGRKAKFVTAGLMQKQDNLTFLAGLYEAGQLRAVIDRAYPLAALPEAHRYVDTNRKTGSVVIQVAA